MKLSTVILNILLLASSACTAQVTSTTSVIKNNALSSVVIMRQPKSATEWAWLRADPKKAIEILKPLTISAHTEASLDTASYGDNDMARLLIVVQNRIMSLVVPTEQLVNRTIDVNTLLFLQINDNKSGTDVIYLNNNTAYPLAIINKRDEPHDLQTIECKPGNNVEIPSSYHASHDGVTYKTGSLIISNGYDSATIQYPCRVYTPHGITTKEFRMTHLDAQTIFALYGSKQTLLTSVQVHYIKQVLLAITQLNKPSDKR